MERRISAKNTAAKRGTVSRSETRTAAPTPTQTRKRLLAAFLLAAAALSWGGIVIFQHTGGPVQSHLQAGIVAAQQAQARTAEAEWKQVIALDPKNADAYQLLGEMYISTQQWDKGADAFQHLAQIAPKTPHVQGNLAHCLYQYGDQMGAYKAAQEELKQDPDHVPSLIIVARVSSSLSHPEQLDDALKRLTTLLPTNAALLRLEAEHLTYGNRFQEAQPVLERLVQASPNEPMSYCLRGINYFNGDPSPEGATKAEADFQHAIQLGPTVPMPHLYLGKLYRRLHQKEKAVSELETAYRLAPDTIATTFELSQIYQQTGAADKAAKLEKELATLRQEDDLKNTLEKRCVADRDNFDNHLRLGKLLLKKGAIHDATYYLSRAALLRPDNAEARAALEQLARVARSAPPEQDIASRLLTEQASSPQKL